MNPQNIGTTPEPIAAPRTDVPAAALPPDATPHAGAAPTGAQYQRSLSPAFTAGAPSTRPARDDWRSRYARRVAVTDFIVIVWVVFGTQIAWLGLEANVVTREGSPIPAIDYWIFSTLLVVLWMGALMLNDTRNYRVIGSGSQEYKRIFDASFVLFGCIAIIAFLTQMDVARGFLLVSLPMGVLFLLLSRWMWRQWLMVKRAQGEYSAKVLLVGSEASVAQVARELKRAWGAGYQVVGCCVPTGRVADTIEGSDIPIMGNVNAIDRALQATQADTVVVTSTDDLPPDKVKHISWSLEQGQQHLVLAPSIADIAGPRIHTRPVAGLPLIHVETPRFSRGQRVAKRATDLALSTIGIIVLSPLLLVLAMIVKFSSPGPVLFMQTRVGYAGKTFRMLKFRSMVQNAEALLPALQAKRDAGNEILFKMTNDPRATRVGRFMRKYSLDELPQLFNVFAGSMSLVGPRPPLPSEVERYADHVHRRFLVKPGVTGLWQVSGRSSLSWDESVRLDLSYVENWSLLGDALLLAKTVRAASRPAGTSA